MIEVSMYYIHSNRNPRYIAFVKYEKFIKVIISSYRSIILSIDAFMSIQYLFEFYLLSLLTTEHLDKINYEKNNIECSISVQVDWKRLYFSNNYRDIVISELKKNPLNSKEPKRQTTDKKIKKFIKNFNENFDHEPLYSMQLLIDTRCHDSINLVEKYIENEKNISIFTGIKKKYGKDIYESILKFM